MTAARDALARVEARVEAQARADRHRSDTTDRLVAAVEAVLAYADKCDAMSTTLADGRTDGITVGLQIAAHDIRNKINTELGKS